MPIEEKDLEYLKMMFITRSECDAINEQIRDELSKGQSDRAVIKSQLKLVLGILSATGVALLSYIIRAMWG